MEKITTLEQALAKIESLKKANAALKKENAELNEELTAYRNRKVSGRRKHNIKWMSNLYDFSVLYEEGKSIAEIVKSTGMSQRTVYRYKEYYDKVHPKDNSKDKNKDNSKDMSKGNSKSEEKK